MRIPTICPVCRGTVCITIRTSSLDARLIAEPAGQCNLYACRSCGNVFVDQWLVEARKFEEHQKRKKEMKCFKATRGCGVYENRPCSECPYSQPESGRSRADSAKVTCDTCRANRVCDHTRFGYETCGNYIPMFGGKLNENS